MVLRGKQCTDIAIEHEVGAVAPLDRLGLFRVDKMISTRKLLADLLLPPREPADVGVDTRVSVVAG